MIVTGVGGDDLALAARRAGVHVRKLRRVSEDEVEIMPAPNGTRFLLYRRDGKPSSRNKTWTCNHGHERLFEEIFRIEPNAHIETVMEVYRGLEDYRLRQPEVAERWRETYGREMFCNCESVSETEA